jgi:hypothetical protein
MKKTLLSILFIGLLAPLFAHIGSPGVIVETMLGKHRMMFNVNPPEVIPGTAVVTVFVADEVSNLQLSGKPIYFSAGAKGTPKADVLYPVASEPGRYEGEIWFMEFGASSVEITLEDEEGMHHLIIPVMAVATAQNEMDLSLGIALSVLGLLLVILMVTIISASVTDGLQTAGSPTSHKLKKRKRIGILAGSTLMILLLWFGKNWWDNWAANYQRFLYQPLQAASAIVSDEEAHYLQLSLAENEITIGRINRKISYIIPDHGKLMHLFLIRKGSLDAFAHLHPKRLDTVTFQSKLPPLPAGDYHVFADISRYSGFSETIISDLHIPEGLFKSDSYTFDDRDDTYALTNALFAKVSDRLDADLLLCGSPGIKTELPGGYAALWETDEEYFKAGKLYSLNFALFDPEGNPAVLEPYLGMMGHAVVMKSDGSVYIHLHPVGNYSMASQQALMTRFASGASGWGNMPLGSSFADSIDRVVAWLDQLPDSERDSLLMGDMLHEPLLPDSEAHEGHQMVSFPYAFPTAGDYRLWLQVKLDGKIVNGAFDVKVN